MSELNTGQLVEAERRRQRVTLAVLARRSKRNASAIARTLNRPSMQVYVLWELSVALNHNFFADLAQQLDAATNGEIDRQITELEQLKTEYNRLKEERDYLRKAMDLISNSKT